MRGMESSPAVGLARVATESGLVDWKGRAVADAPRAGASVGARRAGGVGDAADEEQARAIAARKPSATNRRRLRPWSSPYEASRARDFAFIRS